MLIVHLIDFETHQKHPNLILKGLEKKLSKRSKGYISREYWLRSLIADINGFDFNRFITNRNHPNNALLHSHPKALKYHTEEQVDFSYYFFLDTDKLTCHPKVGVLFNGESYIFPSARLCPPEHLFNMTGFTILLRVFIESGCGTVLSFGSGCRWFGINLDSISLNDRRNVYSFDALEEGKWNDIWVSYNNAQTISSYMDESVVFSHKNSNPSREIFCSVNGEEKHFEIPVDNELFSINDISFLQTEADIYFSHPIDRFDTAHFKGLISSFVWFNQSCTSMKELNFVASTFLKNHEKPILTYQEALSSTTL